MAKNCPVESGGMVMAQGHNNYCNPCVFNPINVHLVYIYIYILYKICYIMFNVYIYIYICIYQLEHGTHDLSIFFLHSFPEMIGALGIASEVWVFGCDRDAKHLLILRYSQYVDPSSGMVNVRGSEEITNRIYLLIYLVAHPN